MTCINITGCQLARLPSAFPAQAVRLNRASPYTLKLGIKFPKTPLKLNRATSRYQQTAPVCLFGGKGNSDGENQGSPLKLFEKVIGSVKKNESVEDLLKQQIQKKEYYDDGGSGGEPPSGGGRGGGGPGEDAAPEDMWEEFGQALMATIGFIFLYVYIIEGEDITAIVKDSIKYVFRRKMSIRLSRLVNEWKMFFKSMTEQEEEDPYWLEREILNTPTTYDHPVKYRKLIKYLNSPRYG